MAVWLAPLDKADTARVMHLRLGDGQSGFVGTIAKLVAGDQTRQDFHVVLRDGTVVGFFKLDRGWPETNPFVHEGDLALRGLIVHAPLQGQGIGAAAMTALPAYVRQHYPAARGLALSVNCDNPAALRLYERAGFRQDADLYHGGPAGPQFVMRLSLTKGSPVPNIARNTVLEN